MKLGDKVTVRLKIDGMEPRTVTAPVVYIHPQGRFYQVEITGPAPNCHKFRETVFSRNDQNERTSS